MGEKIIHFKTFEDKLNALLDDKCFTSGQRKLLKKFYENRTAQGIKGYGTLGVLYFLRIFCKGVNKELEKITKQDLDTFFNLCKDSPKLFYYRKKIKLFYRWLSDYKDNDKYLKLIKFKIKEKSYTQRADILSEEEITKLINSASNLRDKTFISVWVDSGCRCCELVGLNIGDVEPYDDYALIKIKRTSTKTDSGQREVCLLQSYAILRDYINTFHYKKEDNNAPLFYSIADSSFGRRLAWPGANHGIIKKAAKRAGIKRRITSHLGRHTRLTNAAVKDRLSTFELKTFAGWSKIAMADTYVRQAKVNPTETLKRNNGLIKDKDLKKEDSKILKPRLCNRCGKKNAPTYKYCSCGAILDLKEANKKVQQLKLLEKVAGDISEENDLINAIADAIVKKYGNKVSTLLKKK